MPATGQPIGRDPELGRIPSFRPNVRYELDRERGLWMVRRPEGDIAPEPASTEVMALVDGQRSLDDIAHHISQSSGRPETDSRQTVRRVAGELVGLGVLRLDG